MKKAIVTTKAPSAIGPYSQGIATESLLFVSGQLPIDPETGAMPEDIAGQARQSLENLRAVLEAGGSGLDQVVKTTIFLSDIKDFAAVNEVYATYFSQPCPARSCIAVAAIPKDAKLEIEAVALK